MKNGLFYTLSFLAGLAIVVPLFIMLVGFSLFAQANTTFTPFVIFFLLFALLGAGFGVICRDASQSKMVLTSILLSLPTMLGLMIFFIGDVIMPQVPILLARVEPFIASYVGIFLVHWYWKSRNGSNPNH
ncbi:MAG: hypothetical protein Q7S01_05070 [bacterium]|nr:hypothetical protein [bacterium]